MCLSADKLFMLEDGVMKHPGLYGMWTILYVVNLICLAVDTTTGPVRDFNILCSLLSTIYTAVSSYNSIYGNNMPSSLDSLTHQSNPFVIPSSNLVVSWMHLCLF